MNDLLNSFNAAIDPLCVGFERVPGVPDFLVGSVGRLLVNPAGFSRLLLGEHFRCEFNGMHRDSFLEYCRQCHERLPGRRGWRVAIAAPRGAAKSTVHTLLFPIMDLLSGRERHQVIISGTMAQAKGRICSIARELRGNQMIRDVFFDGKVPQFKCNSRMIELGNCRIEAFSSGSEMRGISHGEYRPTRIILDDVEQSRNAWRAYHRQKLLTWYDEVVENLGDSYTHITIVGTIIHSDSLLSTLLERPGFRPRFYQSIIEWDRRPELWREWRRMFLDRSDGEGVAKAETFYRENMTEMLEGVEVLWPGKEPYVRLQEKLLVLGRPAFFKEKQNTPIKDGDQIFDTSSWVKFVVENDRIVVVSGAAGLGADDVGVMDDMKSDDGEAARMPQSNELKYYGFLDPALGKSGTRDGDCAAIVTVAKAPGGALFVMHVWMEKASPMKQIEQVFALHHRFNYQKFGFESNGFQETLATFIKQEQAKLRKAGQTWQLPVAKINNHHSKHSRISLLEPHITSGNILFQQDLPHEFFVQGDEYNGNRSNHDDGLDALASCVEMIKDQEKPIRQIKTISNRETPMLRNF